MKREIGMSDLPATTQVPSLDDRAARLGLAAMFGALKETEHATARCRSRKLRALRHIRAGIVAQAAPFIDPEVAEGAIVWVTRTCATCGKCRGV